MNHRLLQPIAIHTIKLVFLLLWLGLFATQSSAAQRANDNVVHINASEERIRLARHIQYWQEDATALNAQRFPKLPSTQWKQVEQDTISNGYVRDAYWFRTKLINTETQSIKRILAIDCPLIDEIEFLLVANDQVLSHYTTGDIHPFSQRPLANANFRFPIELQPGRHYEIYLRAQTAGAFKLPTVLWEEQALATYDNYILLMDGFFFGALLLMALYNLFIWLSVREISYFYYVLFVINFAATFATRKGYSYQYFWPELVDFNSSVVLLFLCFTIILGLSFSRRFLQLKRYNPRLNKLLAVVTGFTALTLLMVFVLSYYVTNIICVFLTMTAGTVCVVAGIVNYRSGNRSARFYVIAWSMLLLGTICYALMQLGMLPATTLYENLPQVGSLLEALLLSFALADRINVERAEQMHLQVRVMEEDRKANQEREAHLQTQIDAQRQELQARQQIESTRAESSAKSQFLATMSHEIRTPMNGILGISELLRDTPLSGTQQEQLDIIQKSGKALLNIINDILDYSKIEAGKMDIEKIECDLAWLVEDTRQTFAETARRKDLQFSIELVDALPQRVCTDPTRLRQIIGNLLRNALKFTPHGSVTLRIQAKPENNQQQCRLHFAVVDTGVGILPEQQQLLFKPFSQVDASSARKFGGTGMGLTLSQRLVKLMGGDIGFESKPGKGSVFWFEIPCEIVLVKDKELAAADTVHEAPKSQSLVGIHVLIAEDNPVNTMVVKGLIKKLGMTADISENGALAVEARIAEPQRYAAILMDCEMPVMDGYEATRAIREWEKKENIPAIPVIALTAHAMKEHCERADAAGMNGHVAKPIELEMLRNELLAHLR